MTLKERFAFVFLWTVLLSACVAAAALGLLIVLLFFNLFLFGMNLVLGVNPLATVTSCAGIFVGIVLLLVLGEGLDWAYKVNEARLKRQKGESNEAQS